MRRLPVYLLLDTSGSMSGEPLEAVKNGVQVMVSSLRQNPQAIETAYLSIITFGTTAEQLVPLTELALFQAPPLTASGTTALGAALELTAERIGSEVRKTTQLKKGDWKPLVFLLTDGVPTDDYRAGIKIFEQASIGMVVACGVGGAKMEVLREITSNLIHLESTDSQTLSKYFEWLSASIGTSSERVDSAGKDIRDLDELPPPPDELNIVI